MCIPYSDNGKLRALVFNNEGKELVDGRVNINEICGINEESKPILGFYNPMVTACFNHDDNIFFGVHHRVDSIQYNFFYSYRDQCVLSRIRNTVLIDSTILNYPNKTFFNEPDKMLYTFYRQGHALTRSAETEAETKQEKIEGVNDLG